MPIRWEDLRRKLETAKSLKNILEEKGLVENSLIGL